MESHGQTCVEKEHRMPPSCAVLRAVLCASPQPDWKLPWAAPSPLSPRLTRVKKGGARSSRRGAVVNKSDWEP